VRAERAISTVFGRNFSSSGDELSQTDSTNEFYEHEHFNDNNLTRDHKSTEKEVRRENTLSEAEAAALRRDAELGRPVSNLDTPSNTNKTISEKDADDKYIIRPRKDGDNR
jgi:hypothetical protein